MSGLYHAVGKAIGTESASPDLPTYDQNSAAATKAFDQSAYQAQQDAYLNMQGANANARTATQATAAQNNLGQIAGEQYGGATIAPTSTYGGQSVGATQLGTASTLGATTQSAGQNLGAADLSSSATIDRQDDQFRNAQLGLQSQLQQQAQGQGPDLAAAQFKQSTDANIANQAALAASQGGRNAGTVQRGLSLGASNLGMQASNAAAQTRIQEQLNAQQQLAALTASGRSSDIAVNTSQAGLNQQTALANQAAVNTQTLNQANLNQSNNQFNAGALNTANLQQGSMDQQMNLANVQNQLSNQQLQANLYQQAGLANQSAINNRATNQAQLLQQAGLAGSAALTGATTANTQNQQNTNLANQTADLQQTSLNDAMSKYYSQAGLQVDQDAQSALMAQQQLDANATAGDAKLQQSSDEAQSNRFSGFLGGVAQAVAGGVASDKSLKKEVEDGSPDVGKYLDKMAADKPAEKDAGWLQGNVDNATGMDYLGEGRDKVFEDGKLSSQGRVASQNSGEKGDQQVRASLTASPRYGVHSSPDEVGNGSAVSQDREKMDQARAQEAAKTKAMYEKNAADLFGGANVPYAPQQQRPRKMSMAELEQAGRQLAGSLAAQKSTLSAPAAVQDRTQQVPPAWLDQYIQEQAAPRQPGMVTSDEDQKGSVVNGQTKVKQMLASFTNDAAKSMTVKDTDPQISGSQKFGNAIGSLGSTAAKAAIGSGGAAAPGSAMQLQGGGIGIGSAGQGAVSGGMTPAASPAMGVPIDSAMSGGSMVGASVGDSAGMGAGSIGAAISDQDMKKDKYDGHLKVAEYLDNIKPYTYKYKDPSKPGQSEGTYTSPMAQDMEKSELGSLMVKNTPDGKMVDYGHHLGTIHASLAYLNDQLNKVKNNKGSI